MSKKREALLKKALLSLVQSSSSQGGGEEAAGAAKESVEALFPTSGDGGGAASGKRKASKAEGDKEGKKAKGGDSSSSSSSSGKATGKGKKAPASLSPPIRRAEGEGPPTTDTTIIINRAPVMTLWVALVAYRRTNDWPYSLSVARAYADAIATAKGTSIGIFKQGQTREGKTPIEEVMAGVREEWIMGQQLLVKDTDEGSSVALNMQGEPCPAPQAQTYLQKAFKEHYDDVCQAMLAVTESYEDVDELEERAYHMYELFRPQVNKGTAGWGQKSTLSLAAIRQQAKQS